MGRGGGSGPMGIRNVSLRRSELSCTLSEPVQVGGVSMASRVRQAWVRIPVSLSPVCWSLVPY